MGYVRRTIKYSNNSLREREEYFSSRRYSNKICTRSKNKNKTSKAVDVINEKNAEDRLRWYIRENFKAGDLHIALTYHREHPHRKNPVEAIKDINKFLRKMRNYYKKLDKPFKYIWVCEESPVHKVIHFHMVIEKIDMEIIENAWGEKENGIAKKNRRLDDDYMNGLAFYLLNRGRTTFYNDNFPIKQRFMKSSNLVLPKITYAKIKRKSLGWRAEPKNSKNILILKETYQEGVHGITGTPWRRYMFKNLN